MLTKSSILNLGTSVITSDRTIILAPRALRTFGLNTGDEILLYATREGKVSLIKLADAGQTLFHTYVEQMQQHNRLYFHKGLLLAITRVTSYGLALNKEISHAFHLHRGERYQTVRNADESMSLITIKKKKPRTFYNIEAQNLEYQAIPC